MASKIINRLRMFESVDIIPVKSYPIGVVSQAVEITGNSVLSTVWIKSLDPGASVTVNFWDWGPGSGVNPGERVDLLTQGPFTVADMSHRDVATRLHNKVICELVVSGGTAEVGVYVTVVADFPAKIDTSGSDINTNVVTTAFVDNVSVPMANTEISYTLPANTRRFSIKNRGDGIMRLAFTAGDTGTKYWTIPPGTSHDEVDIKKPSLTFYLQSAVAGDVLEVLSWS